MTNPPEWTTSSYSGEQGQCVEVRLAPAVGVRDTKNRAAGQVVVTAVAWRAFLDTALAHSAE